MASTASPIDPLERCPQGTYDRRFVACLYSFDCYALGAADGKRSSLGDADAADDTGIPVGKAKGTLKNPMVASMLTGEG